MTLLLRAPVPAGAARRLAGPGAAAAAVAGLATATVAPGRLPMVAGGALVCCLVGLAIVRFEVFVLALVLVRASVDIVPVAHLGTVIGLLFLVAGGAWLFVQQPVSPPPAGVVVARAWIALVATAAVSSLLVSPHPWASLSETSRMATVAVMFFVARRLFPDEAGLRRLVVAVVASSVVPATAALVQAATGIGTVNVDGIERARGTFLHPNPLALFLVLVIVLALAIYPTLPPLGRTALVPIVAVDGLALFLTYSRGAWIAVVVGMGVVVGARSRRLLPLLAAGVVCCVVLLPPVSSRLQQAGEGRMLSGSAGNSLTWRLDYWRSALPLVGASPLLGIGPAEVERVLPEGKPPHNDGLRALVETGVLGGIAYGALVIGWICVCARCLRWPRTPPFSRACGVGIAAAIAAFVVSAFVSNLISAVAVSWYLAVLAGAASARRLP